MCVSWDCTAEKNLQSAHMLDISGIVMVILIGGCGDEDGTRGQEHLQDIH